MTTHRTKLHHVAAVALLLLTATVTAQQQQQHLRASSTTNNHRQLGSRCETTEDCPGSLQCIAQECSFAGITTPITTTPGGLGSLASSTTTTPAPVPGVVVTSVPMTPVPMTPVPVPATPVPVPMTPVPVPATPVPVPATTVPAATTTPATTTTPVPAPPAVVFANNDRCTSAVGPIPMTAAGLGATRAIITKGTTVGATAPPTALATCNNIPATGPGVYYTVVGTGDLMTASTCWPETGYDTAISVYTNSGNNNRRSLKQDKDENDKDDEDNEDSNNSVQGGGGTGCASLRCVTANDDASGHGGVCPHSSMYSRVQWMSNLGQTYTLLVHGFNNKVGAFDLNVVTHRPLNTKCSDATTLPISPKGSTDTIVGTTFQASLPWGENKSTNCGGRFGLIGDTPSVWYKVRTTTTQTIEASTCHPLTDFDTKLHIFQGSCSSNGSCIGGNDNYNSPARCSLTQWTANAGTDYYILVHAFMVDQVRVYG